ncbi:virulence factor TspB C-terminal domain-related protein [Methylophilus sp. Leaf414]|uniref:virulence factor TspB C-terminal domain-related protein n=1 Tax=Methylophilus sp. Leaf414 TaxID=1736371 RepID=UPI0012E354EE|nr:virulence factor TspB C-terminal domain-related protein [Methylophilus sp. Leaf414]
MLGASYSYAYQCPTGATLQSNSGKVLDKVCVLTSCPANTTLNTTTNVCDDVCLPNKGKIGSFSLNCGVDVSSGTGVCMPNNCAATVVDNSAARVGNCWFGVNNARYTGATCGGQPSTTSFSNPSNANPPPVDAPETNCLKDGKSFGYVNGVPVCVPKGSSSATPVKDSNQSTTTNSSTDTKGNTSSTTSSEVKNATQDGDQVTSSTTKTNADGTKTEETKTESVTSFCATNPTHPICKKAAQEEEEGPDPCEDNPDLPQCIGLGEAEEGGAIATSNKTVSFAPVQITSGGSCPPDKSVSIAGRSITFSYSWLCQYASMFKPFMLAFAYLSAAMFLFMGLRGANT